MPEHIGSCKVVYFVLVFGSKSERCADTLGTGCHGNHLVLSLLLSCDCVRVCLTRVQIEQHVEQREDHSLRLKSDLFSELIHINTNQTSQPELSHLSASL